MAWALLNRFPSFHDGGVTVDVRGAPATSCVMLPHPRIDSSIPDGVPYVLAADKTGGLGLLICFFKPGSAPPDLAILKVEEGALTATLRRLPPREPPVHPIDRLAAIGFIPTPSSSSSAHLDYLVAELQPIPDSNTGRARLITINTAEGGEGEWVETELLLPASHARRPWGRDGVLSHAGMLWWSDLSWGLVGCDPLARAPNLVFVKLPDESSLSFSYHPAIEGRRILSISDSRIRYLEISRVQDGPSRMKLWTLGATADATVWNWEESRVASFARIWAGESYSRTRLPARLPTLTALNRIDPDMVCFHLEGYLVGLHLSSNTVAWVAHHVPADHVSCEIPHYLVPSGTVSCAIGELRVRGFQCRFIPSCPLSTCILIKRVKPSADFWVRLWHKKYPITYLNLVEQFGGSGSVLYSSSVDQVGIHPVVVRSFRNFLLFAPIPDLSLIFNIFGISADTRVENHGVVNGFKPNGRKKLVGSFEDENNRVLFREHDGTPNPILMLECCMGDIECFGMQLMSYLPFHNLRIKMSRNGTSTVSLKVKEDSTELKISSRALFVTYIPVPYLAKVATLFR